MSRAGQNAVNDVPVYLRIVRGFGDVPPRGINRVLRVGELKGFEGLPSCLFIRNVEELDH